MNETPSAARRRFPARLYGLSLLAILLLTFFPVLSVVAAGLLANIAECELNEAAVHPCVIAGHDFGDPLYTMAVLGWLALATIPFGGALLICWAVVFCIHLRRNALRRPAGPPRRPAGD
ncbi:hypothetical protein GCM10011611_10020 [Aliidongia dinghuensis]|uniref:Uncharacterized protein n=1 Tax=Aliidongia dinghuensis TaxID=1867774 RepID=A0A8J2YQW8_9PROT|nr:hypothetical protein GCM10011611_10020 [Aliidongia dinghuensis]